MQSSSKLTSLKKQLNKISKKQSPEPRLGEHFNAAVSKHARNASMTLTSQTQNSFFNPTQESFKKGLKKPAKGHAKNNSYVANTSDSQPFKAAPLAFPPGLKSPPYGASQKLLQHANNNLQFQNLIAASSKNKVKHIPVNIFNIQKNYNYLKTDNSEDAFLYKNLNQHSHSSSSNHK